MILKIKCLLVALAFVSALVFCADEDKSDPSLFALVSKQPPSQERPLKEKLSFPDFITTSLDFQKLLFLKLRSDELKNINLVCKAFYNAVDALQVDRPITLRNIYDISDGDQIEAPTILKNIRHVKKFRIQRGGFFSAKWQPTEKQPSVYPFKFFTKP